MFNFLFCSVKDKQQYFDDLIFLEFLFNLIFIFIILNF